MIRLRRTVLCALAMVLAALHPVAVAQQADAPPPPLIVFAPESAADASASGPAAGSGVALEAIRSDPLASDIRVGSSSSAAIAAALDARVLSVVVPASADTPENVLAFTGVDVEHNDDNLVSLHARDEATDSEVALVVQGADVLGSIRHGDETWKVHPLGDGLTAVYRYDTSRLRRHPRGHGDFMLKNERMQRQAPAAPPRDDAGMSGAAADTGDVIDVLVAYTPAARRAAGNIDAFIQLAIDNTHRIYRNSDIGLRLRLVHKYQTSYTEHPSDMEVDLDRLTVTSDILIDGERWDPDGHMDEVHGLRDRYGADLVALIVARDAGACGFAWAPDFGRYPDADLAVTGFSVTAWNCETSTSHTFAHEIGHNQGADHDPDNSCNDPPCTLESLPTFPYRYGRCNTAEGWHTTMALPKNLRGSCRREIAYFSSPILEYRGTPTGDAARRDNRRVLLETAHRVANYRQSKGSSTTTQTLPLVAAASNRGRQGFMRIINHSERAGTVSIHAIDDTGERFGPVSLSLEATQTRHFNSVDLENGNAAKGLSAGVGDGTGNWRLEFSSELSIEALAYIRTPDGFVTSMHEVAAATEEGSSRYHVPFFNPGSNSSQESLLRLVNPGSGDARVVITGVDDAGGAPPLGEVRLTLGAGAARMLSARELEQGGSGLTGRLGDGTGKWRLSVTGDRPLRVVSLLQLPTGHLTNLSRSRAPQTWWERSGTGSALFDLPVGIERIRIDGEFSGYVEKFVVWCGGPGDRGGLPVNVILGTSSIADGTRYSGVHSARRRYNESGEPCRQLHIEYAEGVRWTVAEVEVSSNDAPAPAADSGGESADRAAVERARTQVLRSRVRLDDRGTPAGDAARRDNRRVLLETARRVANYRQSIASSATTQTLPLVTPASDRGRQGFVRIINHSERAGTVSIHAIDDTGRRFGPVELALEAMQTRHFNSVDLENGNAAKGLSAGVGDGTGNWRLELSSELSIEALAYIRTPDGFVTSMHEVATATEEGSNRYHVPFFNPGSNSSQESLLRLVNPGSGDARVVITGVDDAGGAPPLGEVRLTLGAGAARMLSARELERGGSGLTGRLGDGHGKWRLSVSGDGPLRVVSLLQLPTGHLTNLSHGREGVEVGAPPPIAQPDLVVQSLSVSDTSASPGQSFVLRATVRNQGTARSAATTLRYYRSSDDATISASDTAAGSDAVAGLAASGTSTESISLTAPPAAGTYYYGACIDTVSGELNTRNNCSSAARLVVQDSGSSAITLSDGKCSLGDTSFGAYDLSMSGTLQAHRSVSSVRVDGYANGQFIDSEFVGDISAGQSRRFTLTGTLLDSWSSRFSCSVDVAGLERSRQGGGEVKGRSSMARLSRGAVNDGLAGRGRLSGRQKR